MKVYTILAYPSFYAAKLHYRPRIVLSCGNRALAFNICAVFNHDSLTIHGPTHGPFYNVVERVGPVIQFWSTSYANT